MSKIKSIVISSKELADIFGVSVGYISELVNDYQMPKLGYNKFRLVDCIRFRFNQLQKIYDSKLIQQRDLSNRSRFEAAQAELKEIELQEKRQELAPVAEFETAMKNQILILTKGLESLQSFSKFDLKLTEDQLKNLEAAIYKLRVQLSEVPPNMRAEDVKLNLNNS